MIREPGNGSRELASKAYKLAAEKKAQDMRLLEVGKVSIIADYFLIATGGTAVQVHAICDHLTENLKKAGHYALRIEGYRKGWWVVLDYGSLVIHVFQPESREFYDLERLWAEAPRLDLEDEEDASFLTNQSPER